MRQTLGEAIAEKNGYTIHRVYVVGESGQYIHIGFAVLSPSRDLLGAFAKLQEAESALEQWSASKPQPKPTSSNPSFGM